jgi:hypothetical protein
MNIICDHLRHLWMNLPGWLERECVVLEVA